MAEKFKNEGNAAFQKKDFGKAIENYTYAIECEPNNHTYYTNRATAYAAMKNWEKSLKDAQKSVDINREWVKGHFRKGIALMELQRFEDASKAFDVAKSLSPADVDIAAKYDEAVRNWKKDLTAAQLKKEEGNEFFKLGKIPEAVAAYTKALDLCKPEESQTKAAIFANRANCYVQLYEPNKVVADCSECLNLNPGNIKALLRRAFAYESLDRMGLSLKDFEEVLRVDSTVSQAHQGVNRIRNAMKQQSKK